MQPIDGACGCARPEELTEARASVIAMESRFERFFRTSPVAMNLMDRKGVYVAVNQAWTELTGFEPAEVVGRSLYETLPDDDHLAHQRMMSEIRQLDEWQHTERRFIRPDGSEVWVRRSVTALPGGDDEGDLVLTQLFETTESRTAERRLEENDQLWRRFGEVAPVAVFRVGPDGAVTFITPRWTELTGQPVDQAVGFGWTDSVHPADRRALFAAGAEAFATGAELDTRYRTVRPDGTIRWLDVRMGPVCDADGVVTELIGSATDITELTRAQERLAHLASHDDLTGLANRALLREQLAAALGRAQRSGHQVGVLFCDLDGFKEVNDRAGHDVGDAVLREVAERMCAAVRTGDLVARAGGDEFVVLCDPVEGMDDALVVADRILKAVRAPVWVGGRNLPLGVSVGVALSVPGVVAEMLIAQADQAMYDAKAAGRGRVRALPDPRHSSGAVA